MARMEAVPAPKLCPTTTSLYSWGAKLQTQRRGLSLRGSEDGSTRLRREVLENKDGSRVVGWRVWRGPLPRDVYRVSRDRSSCGSEKVGSEP